MTSKKLHHILLIIPVACFIYTFVFWAGHLGPLDVIWVELQGYNERGEYVAMAAAYGKLAKKYPENPTLLYPLGWALYKTGRYAEAAAAIDEYVERNPFFPKWRQSYVNRIRKAAADELKSTSSQNQPRRLDQLQS
jgi:tetratricopeptide (TPR) repeat protein